MTVGLVSGNHRKLDAAEVEAVAAMRDAAWQDPAIPMRQWVSCVRGELERYRNGHDYIHFNTLVRMLKATELENPTLLDVGASSGFYSEVLKIGGFDCRYTGLDYSPTYKHMAEDLYPGIRFQLGDARALPFSDNYFHVVLSGCVLIHVKEWREVIAEAARVASKYVVMNRTPVSESDETEFFEKTAYNVPCFEVHPCERELLAEFDACGLRLISQSDIYKDPLNHYRQTTYLLEKVPSLSSAA